MPLAPDEATAAYAGQAAALASGGCGLTPEHIAAIAKAARQEFN